MARILKMTKHKPKQTNKHKHKTMRKILILAGIILVSASSFAQKKELKKAQRAYKSNDIAEALTYINQAEGMIGSADDAMKADFY